MRCVNRIRGTRPVAVVVGCAVLVSGAVRLGAQSRKAVTRSVVGRMSPVGGYGGSYDFRRYSSGLGGLSGGARGGSAGALSSSIRRGASFAARRGPGSLGGGRSSTLSPLPRTSGGGLRYTTGSMAIPGVTARDLATVSPLLAGDKGNLALGGAWDYLAATEYEPALAEANKPITTVVPARPEDPDRYWVFLQLGDEAFREGDFRTARERFELAVAVAARNPESLLCLFHARYALSEGSFAPAAALLAKTLRYFPALPLAPLDPKGFFVKTGADGSQTGSQRYEAARDRLMATIQRHPGYPDPDANLILAYFLWFEGDAKGADDALAKAASRATAIPIIEAIDIFRDAIGKSARAPGANPPTTRPANQGPTGSRPAGPGGKGQP